MADIEEILRSARSLEPADRLRLIARLWASLPTDHWAAPTAAERECVRRQLTLIDADLVDEVPWKIVERMTARHAVITGKRIYSAPRRFDMATIFVVTTAYAMLFGGLSALMAPPVVSVVIAAFVTFVGIGQAALFGGLKPRLASILVGVTICLVSFGGTWLFNAQMVPGYLTLIMMIVQAVISGVIFGYIAGVLVGGVFLVADVVRRRFRRQPSRSPDMDQDASATS